MNEHHISRRSLIRSAGLGIGAGLSAGLISDLAPARAENAAATAELWSHNYWAQKGDVKLYMFRKRAGAPKAGAAPPPVLFLVHAPPFQPFPVTISTCRAAPSIR
jgi:hypothetical protein